MHTFEELSIPSDGIGIHWFGQSTYALKHPDGTIIQVDPYYPRERPNNQFIHPQPPLDEASLRTDGVILTHNHGDHTCIESITRLDKAYPDVRYIGPSESIGSMAANGIAPEKMIEVTEGGSATIGNITAQAVWAKPPQGKPEDDICPPDVQHLGFVVEIGKVKVYISGDPINTFANHSELLAPIRKLGPHIGFLTTHPDEGEFPYFDGSVKMASALNLHTAVPAHYNCFVSRNYDPNLWAASFPDNGPEPLIIPYNRSVVYTAP